MPFEHLFCEVKSVSKMFQISFIDVQILYWYRYFYLNIYSTLTMNHKVSSATGEKPWFLMCKFHEVSSSPCNNWHCQHAQKLPDLCISFINASDCANGINRSCQMWEAKKSLSYEIWRVLRDLSSKYSWYRNSFWRGVFPKFYQPLGCRLKAKPGFDG